MKTKNIFKTLAFAMLMPAMLLTTACSNEDEFVNNDSNNQKGYPLQVTVNVTRQGDEGTTRATYNESTKKLSFSSGDKLFVQGTEATAGQFAGELTWQSGGTFRGTIYTKNAYTGTANALLTSAGSGAGATLLPNGYESVGFLFIAANNPEAKYDDQVSGDYDMAFALTKAAGVEQLSYEQAGYYDNGFTLRPSNPILNFTITGLSANTEVAIVFSYNAASVNVNKNVTTNSSGTATFAIGVSCTALADCSLTVGGNVITLGSHELTAGKIYNITRAVTPPTLAQTMTTAGMTVKVKYYYENGENYCLFSSNGDGTYTFQSGYGYAGGDNNMAKALVVENGKLVFKQNFFNPIDNNWSNYGFSVTFYSDNSYSQWIPDTEYGSKNHNPSFISVEVNSVPIALTQKITVADLVKEQGQSWSDIIANNSEKIKGENGYVVRISDNAKLQRNMWGDEWQDVYTHDNYQSGDTYKFEND